MRNGIQVRWEPAGASSHNVCWRNGLYLSRRFSRVILKASEPCCFSSLCGLCFSVCSRTVRETRGVSSIRWSAADCSGTAVGGSWSLLPSVNRESTYHDWTLSFSCHHRVNNGQKRGKRDGADSGEDTAGAWRGTQRKGVTREAGPRE